MYVQGIQSIKQLVAGLECLESSSTLYVDGFWADEIDSFYSKYPPQIPVRQIQVGILWPEPRIRHISIAKEMLQGLKRLASKNNSIELFQNFSVYNETGVLMAGYDFPDDEIEVFNSIPQSTLDRFCALAEGSLVAREEEH